MDTSELSLSFERLIQQRGQLLPEVDQQIAVLEESRQALADFRNSIDEAGRAQSLPLDIADELQSFDIDRLQAEVDQAIAPLKLYRSRLTRKTVNIGVGGPARVGKSTLLQSISGLGDSQIPASDRGTPVTAVRSRIYHSTQSAEVRLTMHTFGSFRDDVLRPFHRTLGIHQVPANVSDLAVFDYPTSVDELEDGKGTDGAVASLQFLLMCKASIGSFESYLTGGESIVGLEELQRWVSYPSDLDSIDRPYLAVREALIHVPFPRAAVTSLGIVDLPGLGEILPDAEERHLRGLQDDTDFVILMVRPNPGSAFWDRRSDQALRLIEQARGPVSRMKDFAAIVVNSGATKAHHRDDLLASIDRDVNEGAEDSLVTVLEADAAVTDNVYEQVLKPILVHLASRLATMDQEHRDAAFNQLQLLKDKMSNEIVTLDRAIQRWASTVPSASEDLDAKIAELRTTLADELKEVMLRYRANASGENIDQEFMDSVESSLNTLTEWAQGAFDQGRDDWINEALGQQTVHGVATGFATDELNAIRNRIVHEYSALDLVCSQHVERLHEEVATVLSNNLGELVSGENGPEKLENLAELAASAFEPCEQLPIVLRQLLGLRLDYSILILPRIRSDLDLLDPQRLLDTGELAVSDMDQLLTTLTQVTEKTAWEIRKSLIEESVTPALALLVALERFEDALIRSKSAKREIARLSRSYRDEVWPGHFKGPNIMSGRVQNVRRSIQQLLAILDGIPSIKQ